MYETSLDALEEIAGCLEKMTPEQREQAVNTIKLLVDKGVR